MSVFCFGLSFPFSSFYSFHFSSNSFILLFLPIHRSSFVSSYPHLSFRSPLYYSSFSSFLQSLFNSFTLSSISLSFISLSSYRPHFPLVSPYAPPDIQSYPSLPALPHPNPSPLPFPSLHRFSFSFSSPVPLIPAPRCQEVRMSHELRTTT